MSWGLPEDGSLVSSVLDWGRGTFGVPLAEMRVPLENIVECIGNVYTSHATKVNEADSEGVILFLGWSQLDVVSPSVHYMEDGMLVKLIPTRGFPPRGGA